ncbi:MAG: hypothetical protein ABSG79_22145 [Bryobacteraceae bacterium]|jgi:hypothetical protein
MTSLWKTLSIISLVAGAMCLAFSFFLPANSLVFAVALALGVALLPAGLIAIITSISSSRIIRDELRQTLRESTGSLEASLGNLRIATSFLAKSRELGLSMVYENRNQALEPFLAHLVEYVNRPGATTKEIVFVGSSLKGLIENNPQYSDQMAKIIQQSQGRCRIRFLLTHPEYAKLREIQEDRSRGALVREMLHAVDWLERRGVPLDSIRVYKGEPTCFMIASTESMLLNPYPYEREASRNFSLIVENTESERSLFYNYWTHHYYRPWYGEGDIRNGFWEGTVRGPKALDTYGMLGISDQAHRNPFLFETKYGGLSGTPLPMLWSWLHPAQERNGG